MSAAVAQQTNGPDGGSSTPTIRQLADGQYYQLVGDQWKLIGGQPQESAAAVKYQRVGTTGLLYGSDGNYYVAGEPYTQPGDHLGDPSTQQQAAPRFATAQEIAAGGVGAGGSASGGDRSNPDLQAEQQFTRERDALAAQQDAAARQQQAQQQQAQLDEVIRNNRVQAAQSDANLQFLYDKFAVETDQGNRAASLATQQAIWGAQRDIQQINYQYGQLQQQAAQFNAQQEMAVGIENQRRTEAAAERRRALAESIGVTAQDAGSRGKLAATLLANPGLGSMDAGLTGGGNFFTDESLTPLTDLLGQRADAAKSPNFLKFTPISAPAAPTIAVPTFGAAGAPMAAPARPVSTVGAGGSIPGGQPPPPAAAPSAATAPPAGTPTAAQIAAGADPASLVSPDWTPGPVWQPTPGFASGGIASGAYMGDEQGAELHIPLGPGEALVIPHAQVKNFLRSASAGTVASLPGMKDGGHVKSRKQVGLLLSKGSPLTAAQQAKLRRELHSGAVTVAGMADGGLFSEGSIFGNSQLGDTTTARNFLAEALKRALAGTPWGQSGRAPTPVEVSAPGTDQLVQELSGSLSALGTGIPSDFFLRRARALTPRGISEGVGGLRRTA
jgi:hypothetical protein